MAKTEGEQNIPSELMYPYEAVLRPQGPLGRAWVYLRYPFGLPYHRKDKPGVSAKQRAQRAIFEKSVRCYNCQPYTGGITPPGNGPRNRSWWFTDAIGSGLWYFDYFMQQTMNRFIAGSAVYWCREALLCFQNVDEGNPSLSFYGNYASYAGYNAAGGQAIIYVKRQGTQFTALEILFQGISQSGGTPHTPVTMHFHEVGATYNCVLLNWNNRPAIGPAVGSYVISPRVGWEVMRIPITVTTEWYAITIEDIGSYNHLWLRGRDPVMENGWAYMVP